MKWVKQCFGWVRRNRTIVGVGLAVILFMGLTGVARFPAVVSVSRTVHCVPDEGKTQDDYVQKTRCWGIPLVFRSCKTDWEVAVRGQSRASTESGEAPGWQGATKGQ